MDTYLTAIKSSGRSFLSLISRIIASTRDTTGVVFPTLLLALIDSIYVSNAMVLFLIIIIILSILTLMGQQALLNKERIASEQTTRNTINEMASRIEILAEQRSSEHTGTQQEEIPATEDAAGSQGGNPVREEAAESQGNNPCHTSRSTQDPKQKIDQLEKENAKLKEGPQKAEAINVLAAQVQSLAECCNVGHNKEKLDQLEKENAELKGELQNAETFDKLATQVENLAEKCGHGHNMCQQEGIPSMNNLLKTKKRGSRNWRRRTPT
jgi:hypothetical protein